jgi:alpha-L-fucosidase 2
MERLLDGNRVYSLLRDHISPLGEKAGKSEHSGGTYPNLLCAHPPFQIDGNFGVTSGIAEMLLQSHDGAVHLLPALPGMLPSGHIKGMKARGGFEIDCTWENGKIIWLKVKSNLGGNLRLRFAEGMVGGKLSGSLTEATGSNLNPFYQIVQIKPPEISPLASFQGVDLPKMQEYDILTKTGNEYWLIN